MGSRQFTATRAGRADAGTAANGATWASRYFEPELWAELDGAERHRLTEARRADMRAECAAKGWPIPADLQPAGLQPDDDSAPCSALIRWARANPERDPLGIRFESLTCPATRRADHRQHEMARLNEATAAGQSRRP